MAYIVELDGVSPTIGEGVFLAPTAVVIGDVRIGDNANIWFGCVLRGDLSHVEIGSRCSIQDNAVIHWRDRPADDHRRLGHGRPRRAARGLRRRGSRAGRDGRDRAPAGPGRRRRGDRRRGRRGRADGGERRDAGRGRAGGGEEAGCRDLRHAGRRWRSRTIRCCASGTCAAPYPGRGRDESGGDRRRRTVGLLCRRALLKAGFEVDMFDVLPTPFGLVRAGVAPDHPKIKSVTRVYERTAGHQAFRFFGGVELGRDITREDLLARYHAVVYAVGTRDRQPARHPRRGPARLARGRPSSSPGTTATPTTPTTSSTSAAGARSWSATATSRSTSRGCWCSTPTSSASTDIADHALEAFARSGVARGRAARPPRPGAGRLHQPRAARARRADARRRDRRPRRAAARRSARSLSPTTPTRPPAQRRDPARVRAARARRASAPRRAALPALAGRDPRRRARRGHR